MSINSVQDIDAETVSYLQEVQNSPQMSVVTNDALLSPANEQCFNREAEHVSKAPEHATPDINFTPRV